MLQLFQTGVCRQRPYVVILLCMLAFDWAKGPIENYLERAADGVHAQVSAGETAVFDKQFGDLARQMDNRATEEQRAQARSQAEAHDPHAVAAAAIAMEAKRSAIWSVMIAIMVAMGVLTLVVMIWMVMARVRDIGWPSAVAFGVLALPLFLRLGGGDIPAVLYYGVQGLFILALIGLAIPPSGYAHDDGTPVRAPVPAARPRGTTHGVPGQFGRRV